MKDTVITTTGCYLYDPGGYSGGYPAGSKVITFNSATGSNLGIYFDSCFLASTNDQVYVYDGNSVNAPLLATISQGGAYALKSSGTSLTVKFFAYGYGTTGRSYGFAARIYTLLNNPLSTEFATVYNGFSSGAFDLADYDKDGDKDILNGGKIFRNDSKPDSLYWFTKQLNAPVGSWTSANMASADFDGDGFKDVFIMGQSGFTAAKMYLNNKNGGFTVSSQAFGGAFRGRCKVVDYNRDGKPDISYIGSSNLGATAFIFKLYINNGNGTFTEQATNITGLYESSLDWADTDLDGDMDLVINGLDGGGTAGTKARFLVNNGNNTFTEKGIGLTSTKSGEISFVDINGDGRVDIMNTGIHVISTITFNTMELLLNNGGNNFSSLPHNLPVMYYTYTEWADYDADGDNDLLMSGTNSMMPEAYLYKNNGNGNFTRITLGTSYSFNPVQWVDINKDGKPDIFVASSYGYSYITKNMGNDVFRLATYPMPIMDNAGGAAAGAAVIEDFDNDGAVDVLFAGSLADYDCPGSASVLMKGQGWRNETVAKFTVVADLNVNPGNIGFARPVYKWGDFDNDGLLDILVTNNQSAFSSQGSNLKIYKNQGNNTFTLAYDNYPGSYVKSVACVDLDNDGKNELVMAPNVVYRWNGASFDLIYQGSSYCCDNFTMAFGDYNKDGYLDMALNVQSLYPNTEVVRIFKNDKTGRLVEVDPNTTYLNLLYIKWIDMDNDGDLDLVGSYFALENNGTDRFGYKSIKIPQYSGAAVGDFNGDGYPDVYALTHQTNNGPTHLYYSQGPNFFYKENTPVGFPNISSASGIEGAEAVDIDNDGDMDIIHSTGNCVNGLMLNLGNFQPVHLQLVNPTNGAQLYTGSTYTINWTGNKLGTQVALLYSTNNGRTYTVIDSIASSGSSGGSYNWTVPDITASDSCLVMVTDHQSASKSAKVFSITNTLATPVLSTLPDTICKNQGIKTISINNLPTTTDNITVSALLDGVSLPVTSGQVQFDANTLTVGKHKVVVSYSKASLSAAATDSFVVIAEVTPKVSLHSNVSTVSNTNTSVVLTATNEQGGGTSPVYTFASDLAFNRILLSESSTATLTVAPSILTAGNNRLYVRMKTSESCYTNQTAIDSVQLVLELSTGIIDPDNSSNVIDIFPNPFNQQITIKGLNSAKTYYFTLANASGRKIFEKRTDNSSTFNITGVHLPTGLYWLTIFEGANKRQIGTMKLTRLP